MIFTATRSNMAASDYYTIGEFAKISGLSSRALRFYDKAGLFRPAAVEPRTRYRRYLPRQLEELGTILTLRELGASLADIRRAVGKQRSERNRQELLERLKSATQSVIQEARQSLDLIDLMLDELDHNRPPVPVTIRRRPAMAVASLRVEVNTYAEIERYERELRNTVPAALASSVRGVLWHRCADSGPVEGEPFVALKLNPDVASPRFGINHLPPVTVVCAYSDLDETRSIATYNAVSEWLQRRGYTITGPRREIDLGKALEIQFPIG